MDLNSECSNKQMIVEKKRLFGKGFCKSEFIKHLMNESLVSAV